MQIVKNTDNLIYAWFPVLPFLAYWIVAYLAFHFGPFVTPSLDFFSHVYFIVYVGIFAISYRFGLRISNYSTRPCNGIDDNIALKLLKRTSWLTFIGTLLFVYDRFSSGAGSLDAVQNDLANVRGDYAEKITLLTTFAVIPQSFRIVAVATYFYSNWRKLKIPKSVHWLMLSTFLLELVNMVVSANRGSLFWIISYGVFYVMFCLRVRLMGDIFSTKYLGRKLLFGGCVAIAYWYFLWVAQHREVASTAEFLGREASYLLKDPTSYSSDDFATLGARHHLFYYLTHGFQYVDAILKRAPMINVDILSPLGIRIEAQLGRFSPGYVFPAKLNILEWITAEGLSTSGWPTIFGASLAYFGLFGSLLFSMTLGYLSGCSVRKWIKSSRLGWLVIVLLVFSSLNMSFDWIIKDFDQFVALGFGLYLVRRRSQPMRD